MPQFPIVDAHVHLYDPDRFSYAWMRNVPAIRHLHSPETFRKATAGIDVDAYVFVEVWIDDPLQMEEARWVAGLAERDLSLTGIVPSLALEKGRAIEQDLSELVSLGRVKAVRRLIEWEPDIDFCIQPDFIDGVRLLAEHDLGFDLCIKHFHLPNAARLVDACPDTRFVLDHIGKPPIKDNVMDPMLGPWREHIAALAERPNVMCKLSGVITEDDHDNWSRERVRPYVEHAIDVFGFDRVMYGSDWPVSDLTHAYGEWVDILEWITSGCSEQELKKLFRDNAIRFYKLGG